MSPFFLLVYLILGGILGGLLSTIASNLPNTFISWNSTRICQYNQ